MELSSIFALLGLLLILASAYGLRTGETWWRGRRMWKRAEHPVAFWIEIATFFLLGLFLIGAGLIHFFRVP
ncbi:MAG: hypothetical protein JNM27_03445 [Leptospirales bacterium]|nr:hypothetical protein [Leptospirales bacterium]